MTLGTKTTAAFLQCGGWEQILGFLVECYSKEIQGISVSLHTMQCTEKLIINLLSIPQLLGLMLHSGKIVTTLMDTGAQKEHHQEFIMKLIGCLFAAMKKMNIPAQSSSNKNDSAADYTLLKLICLFILNELPSTIPQKRGICTKLITVLIDFLVCGISNSSKEAIMGEMLDYPSNFRRVLYEENYINKCLESLNEVDHNALGDIILKFLELCSAVLFNFGDNTKGRIGKPKVTINFKKLKHAIKIAYCVNINNKKGNIQGNNFNEALIPKLKSTCNLLYLISINSIGGAAESEKSRSELDTSAISSKALIHKPAFLKIYLDFLRHLIKSYPSSEALLSCINQELIYKFNENICASYHNSEHLSCLYKKLIKFMLVCDTELLPPRNFQLINPIIKIYTAFSVYNSDILKMNKLLSFLSLKNCQYADYIIKSLYTLLNSSSDASIDQAQNNISMIQKEIYYFPGQDQENGIELVSKKLPKEGYGVFFYFRIERSVEEKSKEMCLFKLGKAGTYDIIASIKGGFLFYTVKTFFKIMLAFSWLTIQKRRQPLCTLLVQNYFKVIYGTS